MGMIGGRMLFCFVLVAMMGERINLREKRTTIPSPSNVMCVCVCVCVCVMTCFACSVERSVARRSRKDVETV
jgi:hypothetical protein